MEKEILKEDAHRTIQKSVTHDVVDQLASDIALKFNIEENSLKDVIATTLEGLSVYKRKNILDCRCESCRCEK